jgi:hypothetical protein
MDWKTLSAEYTELGRTMVVARPALAFELYGEGPRMASQGQQILDRFLTLLPQRTELHVLGNNDRAYKKVTPQSLRRIQKTLAELEKRGRFYTFKNAPEFEVGTFSLELHLGSSHRSIADTVQIACPVEWGDAEKVERTVEVFASFVSDFPF